MYIYIYIYTYIHIHIHVYIYTMLGRLAVAQERIGRELGDMPLLVNVVEGAADVHLS